MAKQLKFENVISLGVSYSWENGINSSTQSCDTIVSGEEWVKRVKDINLDVLNTDLGNQGGQVVEAMALNQDRYLDTSEADIYANGSYFGNGKMVGYSIKEGSQSNNIISSLNYRMETDGADPDPDNIDKLEDPVSREESITVSRDIKSKTYKIEHSYDINYGSEFDLVSDHPLYSNKPSYESAEGRLLLGQNKANQVVNVSPIDYLQYVPSLSKYTLSNGWDLKAISDDCFGKKTTTTENKDFINGNYSLNKTIEISYTGEDIETGNLEPWTIEYKMSWSSSEIDGELCGTATMDGTVSAGGILGVGMCGPDQATNSKAAQSGYNYFVSGGIAKSRMQSWYSELNELLPKNSQSTLNPEMINLTALQCTPSVQKGGSNDGSIKFSFEMNNCTNQKTINGSPYVLTEKESTSRGFSECNEEKIPFIKGTTSKSVQGKCGQQIDTQGNYPRFQSITGIQKPNNPVYPNGGTNGARWSGTSSSYSYNKYQANIEWSTTFSDSPKDENCKPRACGDTDGCGQFETKVDYKPKTPRYVDVVTPKSVLKIQVGNDLPKVTASSILTSNGTGCVNDLTVLLSGLSVELIKNKPSCFIEGLSWNYSTEFLGDTVMGGTVNGID